MMVSLWMSVLFIIFFPGNECQLFLGPCPPPPNHMQNVDFEMYAGQWFIAATTSHDADRQACSKVEYTYNKEGKHLKLEFLGTSPFVSGSKTGRLEKKKGSKYNEIDLVLDNFPRRWHFNLIATNYASIAVEYRCLDGVFHSTQEVIVLTRDKPPVDMRLLMDEFKLHDIIPKEFFKKLIPVNQEDCPKPLLRPCPRANVSAERRGNSSPVRPSTVLTLLASVLSGLP